MIIKLKTILSILLAFSLLSCQEKQQPKSLAYIGQHEIKDEDTLYYQIPPFSFLNQDSILINNKKLSDRVYVADFFYTNCPTICPIVTNQMLRIYDQYEGKQQLKLVSFVLDPKRDNVENLKSYAENIGVKNEDWYFLTGDKDRIWELAEKFFVSVAPDPNDLDEIAHSGKIILVDKAGHVRGFAEGTSEEEVNSFMSKIDLLLREYNLSQ